MKVLFERVKLRPPYRVLKGGSWFNNAQVCLAAFRLPDAPGNRFNSMGFRPIIRIRGLG